MAKKKKKRRKSNKGTPYEREISKQLSLWWTESERDDVFWRATTSGARATVRARQGKATSGQYGDIAAIDPIGKPLLDFMVIEVKRGYKEAIVHALLDAPASLKREPTIEEWIRKARLSRSLAKSMGWAIVHKRDRRDPLMYLSTEVWDALNVVKLRLCTMARIKSWRLNQSFYVVDFDEWLSKIKPSRIKAIVKWAGAR